MALLGDNSWFIPALTLKLIKVLKYSVQVKVPLLSSALSLHVSSDSSTGAAGYSSLAKTTTVALLLWLFSPPRLFPREQVRTQEKPSLKSASRSLLRRLWAAGWGGGARGALPIMASQLRGCFGKWETSRSRGVEETNILSPGFSPRGKSGLQLWLKDSSAILWPSTSGPAGEKGARPCRCPDGHHPADLFEKRLVKRRLSPRRHFPFPLKLGCPLKYWADVSEQTVPWKQDHWNLSSVHFLQLRTALYVEPPPPPPPLWTASPGCDNESRGSKWGSFQNSQLAVPRLVVMWRHNVVS